MLRAIIADIASVPVRAVTDESTLTGLGLDSLDRVVLVTILEEHAGRPLSDALIAAAVTVADLYRCLDAPAVAA